MSKLSDISYIRAVMGRHGVNFSKGLGQNFLINPGVCPKMAAACRGEEGVIEVGPGVGILTWELAQQARKVVTIELDKRLLPVLEETLEGADNIKVINDDIMKVDLHRLIREEFPGMQVSVCANLPYYITSPVIMCLLEEQLPLSAITVMVQKEAAERLCALPGTRACGAISAAVRYYCEPEILFGVSRGSFLPAPNVDSAVIRLNVLKEPPVQADSKVNFFKLVKAAFAQRRKTVGNAVASGLSLPKEQVLCALREAEIAENSRAEALSLQQLCNLSNAIFRKGDRDETAFG